MFIRFYNKCVMCDKIYYEPEKIGCTTPSLSCPDCRKYFKRVKSLGTRVPGTIDYKFIRLLLDRDTCEYCGRKLSWEEREIEHKTPTSRGGNNSNSNLCISCHQCNAEKSDRTYEEYISYRKTLKVTASDIKKMLDIFASHTLLETESKIVETEEHKPSEVKHKIIKDEHGKIIGSRKIFESPDIVKVKRKITESHLTDWGVAYNTFCNIVGKKVLKEGVETVILEETPIIA